MTNQFFKNSELTSDHDNGYSRVPEDDEAHGGRLMFRNLGDVKRYIFRDYGEDNDFDEDNTLLINNYEYPSGG